VQEFLSESVIEIQIYRVGFTRLPTNEQPIRTTQTFHRVLDRRDQNHSMTSGFLNEMARQLRKDRSPACGRSIQQILTLVVARFEAGKYPSQVEAESEFRKLVNEAFLRISNTSSA
jgi:hypothetical protein